VRVLLVEDSSRVVETVSASLRRQGHSVVIAGGLREANEACERNEFDVAIVDVGLPDGSGLGFCRQARSDGSALPILLLTARTGIADRVDGLQAGADDYLCKPFAIEELLARVRALGRRGPRWVEASRTFGRLVVDRDRRTVTVGKARLPLTSRELEIVILLAWRGGRVVARDEILESVWGETSERGAGSLDVLVARIRRKLENENVRDALRTIRNVGYSWALEASARD
jgi:DNA-binding response OmpR family regulator